MKGDWNYRKIRELSPDYKSGALPLRQPAGQLAPSRGLPNFNFIKIIHYENLVKNFSEIIP
jgi:hypothetical protein